MKTLSVIFIGFLSINLIVHFSWAIQQFDDNVQLSLNEDTLIFAHVVSKIDKFIKIASHFLQFKTFISLALSSW